MKIRKKSKHSLMSYFMAVLGAVLVGRLFMLTVIETSSWSSFADDMCTRAVYGIAPRGDILDRNGEIMAASRPVYSVNINKSNRSKEEIMETAVEVLDLLEDMGEDVNVTSEEVRKSVFVSDYSSYVPITLSHNVSRAAAKEIRKEGYEGVEVSVNYVREYPQGATASHIIGYMGKVSSEESDEYTRKDGYRQDSPVGKDGIEKRYERHLKGEDSVKRFQVDSYGEVTGFISQSKAKKGKDIRLTIDSKLQKITEDALENAIRQSSVGGTFESAYGDIPMVYAPGAGSGAAVVLDVKSGEVLSMASFPDFDPNDFVVGISEEKWDSLQQQNPGDPMSPSPMYNVAAMTAVQPGSAFKPVTALAALDCGLDPKRYLYDGGNVELGGRSYGCHLWNDQRKSHGYVSLKEALGSSCNYYFYDIAAGRDFASGKDLGYESKIDNDIILKQAKRLGLGEKTGIEIGESAGTIPSEELKMQGVKNSLRNYLYGESEKYFTEESLKNREQTKNNIDLIVNWADKGLTLKEIIGKLIREDFVKKDKVENLASVCKYSYFDQIKWTQGDTFNISIGQGDNGYTTLQMANYMASLANGGVKNDVTLIMDNVKSHNGNRKSKDVKKIDVDTILEGMTDVVRSTQGSLYGVFSSFPYDVAAKTGTAQRAGKKNTEEEREYLRRHLHLIAPDITMEEAEEEARRLKRAYPDIYKEDSSALRRAVINKSNNKITEATIDRYKKSYDSFAWVVALAPVRDPQIAVAVMLVEGKTSLNAAPVAREIIGMYGERLQWEKSY